MSEKCGCDEIETNQRDMAGISIITSHYKQCAFPEAIAHLKALILAAPWRTPEIEAAAQFVKAYE